MKYEIKCDDCKKTIGRTDFVAESAQGGQCDDCRRRPQSWHELQLKGED